MKRKRRTFTPEIKSKIALEAMKGEMIAYASPVFDRGKRISDQAEQSARKEGKLYKIIGELNRVVEFFKKSCRKLGIELPSEHND